MEKIKIEEIKMKKNKKLRKRRSKEVEKLRN